MNKFAWSMITIILVTLIISVNITIISTHNKNPYYDSYEQYILDRMVIPISFGSVSHATAISNNGKIVEDDYVAYIGTDDYHFKSYEEAYRWLAKIYSQKLDHVEIWIK